MNERALPILDSEAQARPRRRRKLSWPAIAVWAIAVLALLVVARFGFWTYYERSGRLSDQVIAFANRHLASASNLRFSARRLVRTRDGVILQSPLLEVRDDGRWVPVLRAERADLRVNLWSLWRGRAQNYEVRLTSPVFQLVYGTDGKVVLPRLTASGKKRPPRDGVRVFLDQASFEVLGRKTRTVWLRKGRLAADVLPEGNGYRIALSGGGGELPPLGLVVQDLQGEGWNAEGRLDVRRLVARTDAGLLDLRGAWERNQLAVDFKAENWPWEFLGEILEQPALDVPGRVDLEGRISGTFERTLFATTARGQWRGESFVSRLEGHVAEEGLVLGRANVHWREASLDGRAEFERSGAWFLEGRLAGLDLSEVDRLWPGVQLPATRLGGPARIEGGAGKLLVTANGLQGEVRGVPIAEVRGTWNIGAGRQALEARGNLGEGPVEVAARWDRRTLDLTATGTHLSLPYAAALDERARGLAGTMSGSMKLSGPLASPHLTANVGVASASFGAARADSFHASAEGVLGKARHVALRARAIGLASGPWRADSALAVGSYDQDRLSLPAITATHADTTLSLALRIERAPGGWRAEAFPARLLTPQWRLEAEAPLVLSSQDGVWHVERARLGGDLGHLEIAGSYRNQGGVDLTLSGRALDLEILGAALRAGGVSGTLNLDAHLTGDGTRRRLEADLSSGGIVTSRARYDSLQAGVVLEARGDRLEVERLRLATRGGTLEGSGGARLSGRSWPLSPGAWLGALRQASEWRGDLRADRFDLSLLSGVWRGASGLTGVTTGHVSLGGQPSNPQGSTEGSIADFAYGGYRFDTARWRARFANGTLALEDLEVTQDSVRSTARGSIPLDLAWDTPRDQRVPDRPMDVRIAVPDGDLAVLPAFLPFVATAQGGLKADIHLTGTPRHPQASGAIQASQGQVRFTGREEIYHDVSADLALENEIVRIKSFRARQEEEGVLEGSGTATLGAGHVQTYDLKVTARRATAVASGEYAFQFNGDFQVGPGPRIGNAFIPIPSVKGTVNVLSGVLLYDFTDPANRVYFVGPRQAPTWVYDLEVHAPRQVYWRTPNANVEMSADLTTRQTMEGLEVWGTVKALRGDYYFLENKFRVEEGGTLTFDQIEPLNPTIDARATASITRPVRGSVVTREDVTIELSGRVKRPTVRLTSSSNLSETQIVRLLVSERFGIASASALGQENQALAVGTTGGQYLVRQLAREIPEASDLLSGLEVGTTVVESGQTGRVVPKLGFGYYLSRDVRVRYSQVVGGYGTTGQSVDIRDLGAEYRINKIFFLTGEVVERRNGSLLAPGTPQSEVEYNVDLRARYEY